MPTTESSDSTAGRVTRSLRKRLTSIDSDASSRPGTPVLNNLQTIPEIVTPSKRVMRRTSLSTPLATPSKSKGRLEIAESPARRSTRRRTVSILEEEHAIQTKSKEPSVVAVQEEETIAKTPKAKNLRVTRSSSKSPLETNSSIKKSTPETEVINLDDTAETSSVTPPASKNKKQTKVLLKKEKSIDVLASQTTSPEDMPKTSARKKQKDKTEDAVSTPSRAPKDENISLNDSKTKNRMTFEKSSPAKAQTPRDSSKESDDLESNTKLDTSQKDTSRKNRCSVVLLSPEKALNSPRNKKIQPSPSVVMLSPAKASNSPQNKKFQLSPAKTQPLQDSPQKKKTRPEKLKNVAFNETAEEDTIKSVFPKTPGLTKSKSYILDSSKDVDKETSTILASDKETIDEEHHDANAKTPYKLKLKAVESSTPIQSASPKRNKITEVKDQTQESPKETKKNDSVDLFPKSWTQSVSGKVSEKAKIDSIESEENMRKKLEIEEALKQAQLFSLQKQGKKKDLDDSDDDDMLEEDGNDDYNTDQQDDEECDREKTVFLDDEAMEVPEGEESMDSEERAYLEENEVPVYGESIGSEDSEEGGEFEEEADEEDEAFIVSDSEDVRFIIESDSDDGTDGKGSGKKYKRIRQISESSDEGAKDKVEEQNSSNVQEESANQGTSQRKSLKNKEDEAIPDGITKNVEEAGDEKKVDTDSEPEIESLSKKGKQSPKKNVANRIVDDDDSDVEMKEVEEMNLSKSRKSLNKSNRGEVFQVDSPNRRKSLKNQEEQEGNAYEISKADTPNKRKSLEKSMGDEKEATINDETEYKKTSKNERMSLSSSKHDKTVQEDVEREQASNLSFKSPKESRKSLNRSKPHISETADDSKSNLDKESAPKSPNANSVSEEPKSPATSSKRKSINHTAQEKNTAINPSPKKESRKSLKEDENTSKSAKSMNKSKADLDQEDIVEPPTKDKNQSLKQARNSVGNVNSNEEEYSPREENLNVSRKSLKKDGAHEEENQQSVHSRSLNKSKLDKTVLSFEDGSEPEDTLSASEVPSRTSGGSLNSSRKSRKSSLNQSKISLPSDKDSEPEEAELKATHSISQNILRFDSTPEVSASEEEKEGDDEEDELRFSDTEEEHKNPAERSTMFEFLGEEDDTSQHPTPMNLNSSRRKSVVNNSKLDETFEMEIGNSLSMRDSLHRSIMRKSLNQSQLHRQMESEEDELAAESDDSSDEEEVTVHKKVLSKQGLSVSLSNIEFKKKKLKGDEKKIHNSFTIGVSVRAPRPLSNKTPSSESVESDSDHVLSELEDLEKIQNVHRVGAYKSKDSLSTSLRVGSVDPDDTKQQKRIKRTSLYTQENAASQSFIDNITEEKQKVESKRKRKSNSFCGAVVPSDEHHIEEEPTEEKPLESGDKNNIQRILSRCDEILEAANLAKRDAKLNAKKSKAKKPKWMDKQEKAPQAVNEVTIPLVSKKELKRKEKIKKELAKAIKHSTAMLKTIDPKLGKKLKTAAREIAPEETDDNTVSSKRLPTEFLRALEEVPQLKKKKSNEIETTPPSDKENSKKSSNKDNYLTATSDISIEKKKKKHNREILETATGTVIVEPSTPVKLRCQNGFRESPKTPVGFKIQDIHSAGQNKKEKTRKRAKKLFTASGDFVEEDLSKANTKRDKTHKRKRHIEEPSYSLPKTQWTPSGVFVEEDLYNARPLANSTATQFMVSSLSGNKKMKNPKVVSSTTLSSALSFKQNALFGSKVRRETAQELIHRKQRKIINNKF